MAFSPKAFCCLHGVSPFDTVRSRDLESARLFGVPTSDFAHCWCSLRVAWLISGLVSLGKVCKTLPEGAGLA
jgi:hypothetical protein